MHKVDDQLGSIQESVDMIGKFWGRPRAAGSGPGLTQTYDTLDYLSQAGIEYIGDWVLDDEPVTLQTTHKPVVALPYNFELHDIVMMALQTPFVRHDVPALDGCLRMPLRGVRGARRKSWRSPCHPYLSGQPHRIGHVERTFDGSPVAARRRVLERRKNPRLVSRNAEGNVLMSGFFVPHDLKAPLKGAAAARSRASPPQ